MIPSKLKLRSSPCHPEGDGSVGWCLQAGWATKRSLNPILEGIMSKMFPRRVCTNNNSSPKIEPGDLRSQASAAGFRDFFDTHPLLFITLLTFCRAKDLWLCLLGSWWKDGPAPNCYVTPVSFRQRWCNMKTTALKPNGDFSGHIFKAMHESGWVKLVERALKWICSSTIYH